MDERWAAIGVRDQIRRLAEDVAAASVTIEVMSQQAEALENSDVQVHEATTACGRELCGRKRIVELKESGYATNLAVEPPRGIDNELGDHVRGTVGDSQSRASIVQLIPYIGSR